ncbi:hypothetical protein BCR39DRAFT_522401 [Naematelia encephala]|uniref:Uncharacterized protein n=1 Tax=Naematelia encephala TaxID=71784 RepID=A0A1Y2BEM6_9TREE|nr:hypothetical protein BCR39DRAFT_522401 [Naematelia encephala]
MFTPYQHISVFRFEFFQLDPHPGTNTWEPLVHPDAALPYIELAVPEVHETHTIVITPGPDGRIMIQIVPMPDYRHNYVAVFDWKAGVCLGLVWSPDEPGLSYSFDFLTPDIIVVATSHDIADSSAPTKSLEALTLDEESERAPEHLAVRFFKLLDYAESMDPMEKLVLSPPGTPVAGWRLNEVYPATPLSALLFPPLRRGRSTWYGVWEAWYQPTSFTLNVPSTYDGRGILSFVFGGDHEAPAFDGLQEDLTHALGAIDISLLSGLLNEGRLVQWDEWRHAVHLMTSSGGFTAAHDTRTVEVIEEETTQDDTSKWLITIRDYIKASSTSAAFATQHAEAQVQPLIEMEALDIQEDTLTDPIPSLLRQVSPPSRVSASTGIPPQRHMFSADEIHAHLDHVAVSFELEVSARDELRWVLYDGDRIILSFPDSVKVIYF